MRINNLQRMVENLPVQEAGIVGKIKSLAGELEKNEDEKTITEMMIMLSRVASRNKLELEAALYNENRGFSRIGN